MYYNGRVSQQILKVQYIVRVYDFLWILIYLYINNYSDQKKRLHKYFCFIFCINTFYEKLNIFVFSKTIVSIQYTKQNLNIHDFNIVMSKFTFYLENCLFITSKLSLQIY